MHHSDSTSLVMMQLGSKDGKHWEIVMHNEDTATAHYDVYHTIQQRQRYHLPHCICCS